MKVRGLGLAAGLAVIAGLLYAGAVNGRNDRDDQRARDACMTFGAVASDCDTRYPDIERSIHEDCSGVRGLVCYWRDPEGTLRFQYVLSTLDVNQGAS